MNPHELNKLKNRAPLAILLIFVASVLIPYLYLDPLIARANEISTSFDKEIADSIRYIKKAKVLRKKSARSRKLFDSLSQIASSLPAKRSLPAVIDTFHDLAKSSGLIITDVKYEMSEFDKKFKVPSIIIKFRIKAEYNELRQFLAGLEKMNNYPLLIHEIVASSGGTYSISIRQLVKS